MYHWRFETTDQSFLVVITEVRDNLSVRVNQLNNNLQNQNFISLNMSDFWFQNHKSFSLKGPFIHL